MRLLVTVLTISLILKESCAQKSTGVISLGEKHSIQSSVLREIRELLVYAPEKINTKLPLILVFDGGGLFNVAVSTVQFMTSYSEIPQMSEAVIIGIENTDRNRDMPIPQQYGKGGEDNFLKFLKEELLPWAGKRYSLNGHVISIGHSQGAYFVTYQAAKFPEIFSWAIALDAPMDVDKNTTTLKELFSQVLTQPANKIRYASVDAVYGWGDQLANFNKENKRVMTKTLQGESHESMAFPGLYEGLKFLFNDFSPSKKDLNLDRLQDYYKSLSEDYGKPYEIPLEVLLSSASRKIPESRKTEVMHLLEYAEIKYGRSDRITRLKTRANAITNEPDTVIDTYLNLPKPDIGRAKTFVGKWKGDIVNHKGDISTYEVQLSIENNIPVLKVVMRSQVEENANFHITDDGKLIWVLINRGGGIIVTTCRLNTNGDLEGTRKWLGFTITDDIPENDKIEIRKILNHKGEFTLKNIR